MESRQLHKIHSLLEHTDNKSLFATVSPLHQLSHPPIPLTGDEMFQQAANLIRRADHEVLIAFYKFEMDSEAATVIMTALKELMTRAEEQKKIINIYFLVNSRGLFAELLYRSNADLDFSIFSKSKFLKFHFNRQVTFAMGSLHNKMIIVDGKAALLLGGDPQHANDQAKHQAESAVLLHGEISKMIRQDFVTLWHSIPAMLGEAQIIPALETDVTASPPIQRDDDHQFAIPCLYISKRANGNPLAYTNCQSPYKIAIIHAINNACESIKIITPNLNDPEICNAIVNACARQVKVSIVTGKHHNESMERFWGGTNLEAIAAIMQKLTLDQQRNFNVKWAVTTNKRIVNHGEPYTIHAKFICIDDELVFAGSSPLDTQAMKYSREADIIFEDKHTARLFCSKLFNTAYADNKDYYEDTYYKLFIEIELQLIRIEKSLDNPLKIDKAEKLREALRSVTTEQGSYHDKLISLLNKTLPILQIATGSKPGMPTSYNAIVSVAAQYGLSDKIALPNTMPSLLAQFSFYRSASSETVETKQAVAPRESKSLSNSR